MKMATRIAGGLGVLALVIGAGATALTLGGAGSPAPAAPTPAPAEGKTYTIDPVHSNVIFKIKHLGASNFYGRFNETTGTFTPGDSLSISATTRAESVDTHNDKRDTHVKSPDFLSAKEFPEIKFEAKDLKKSGDGWKGTGNLTLHGQTKPIEVEIHQVGSGKGMQPGVTLMGLESTFTIHQERDFGVKTLNGALGDTVTITVSLEGGAK